MCQGCVRGLSCSWSPVSFKRLNLGEEGGGRRERERRGGRGKGGEGEGKEGRRRERKE